MPCAPRFAERRNIDGTSQSSQRRPSDALFCDRSDRPPTWIPTLGRSIKTPKAAWWWCIIGGYRMVAWTRVQAAARVCCRLRPPLPELFEYRRNVATPSQCDEATDFATETRRVGRHADVRPLRTAKRARAEHRRPATNAAAPRSAAARSYRIVSSCVGGATGGACGRGTPATHCDWPAASSATDLPAGLRQRVGSECARPDAPPLGRHRGYTVGAEVSDHCSLSTGSAALCCALRPMGRSCGRWRRTSSAHSVGACAVPTLYAMQRESVPVPQCSL